MELTQNEILKIKEEMGAKADEILKHFESMSSKELGEEFARGMFLVHNDGRLEEALLNNYKYIDASCKLCENGDLYIKVTLFTYETGSLEVRKEMHNVEAFEWLEEAYERRMKKVFS